MNCDCIKDIQVKMAAYMVPQAGEDAEARVANTALCIIEDDKGAPSRLVQALQIPFRITQSQQEGK